MARLRPLLRVLFPVLTIVQLALIVEQTLVHNDLTDYEQQPLPPQIEESSVDQDSGLTVSFQTQTYQVSEQQIPIFIDAKPTESYRVQKNHRGTLVLQTGPPLV